MVLFFYPLDFTFVCPTEITAFSDRYDEFKALDAEVLGVSIDSQFSHLAWCQTGARGRRVGGRGGAAACRPAAALVSGSWRGRHTGAWPAGRGGTLHACRIAALSGAPRPFPPTSPAQTASRAAWAS